jgi:hypothetical protein
MLERFPLSRFGTAIERFATDTKKWKVLLALHFALKHFRKAEISFNLREETCCKLIKSGKTSESLLASALLYKVVECTSATYSEVRELFGEEIYESVFSLSKELSDDAAFKNHFSSLIFLTAPVNGNDSNKLIEERYPLNRDGVFLERFALENNYWRTLLMLHYSNKRFLGLRRDDGADEIDHSTSIACAVIDRGRFTDERLAIALGHDNGENAPATDDEERKKIELISLTAEEAAKAESVNINPYEYKRIFYMIKDIRKVFGNRIADDIRRLTKFPGQSLIDYYYGILESEDASAVKAVDKENIASTMIIIFPIRRLKKQNRELKEQTIPFMKTARNKFPDLKGIFFSCRRHIKSIILSVDRYINVVEFIPEIFEEVKKHKERTEELLSLVAKLKEKKIKPSNFIKVCAFKAEEIKKGVDLLEHKEKEFKKLIN